MAWPRPYPEFFARPQKIRTRRNFDFRSSIPGFGTDRSTRLDRSSCPSSAASAPSVERLTPDYTKCVILKTIFARKSKLVSIVCVIFCDGIK